MRDNVVKSASPSVRPGVGKIILYSLVAVVAMFAAAFAPVIATRIPYFRDALSGALVGQGNLGVAIATIAAVIMMSFATLCALLLVWLVVRYTALGWESLGIKFDRRALLWLLGMVCIAILIGAIVTVLSHYLPESWLRTDATQHSDTWWATVIVAFSLAFLLQGIPEELIWRGWLIPALGGGKLAVGVSVGVFTICHLFSQGGQESLTERLLYLALPAGFAFAAAVARVISGSVWAAVGVHAGFHLSTRLWSELGMPSGPVIWILLGLLWSLLGVILLKKYPRHRC